MNINPWQVQIQGWSSDLEHLAKHFTASSMRVLKDEIGSFLYESDSFKSCIESSEVLKLANEELSVLSGVLKFVLKTPEILRTGAVYKKNEFGGKDVTVCLSGIQLRTELGELTSTTSDSSGNIITKPTPPTRTITIMQLAITDTLVAKAMRLIAAPDHKSWVGMYRIHEVIEEDVGGEYKLQSRDWGSTKDLKRFKHSANSVSVGGDSARHGKEVEQPPNNPMSIDEAYAYLNYVLQSWLSSKD